MAKYVFLNIPAYGHVNPTFAIVQELIKRGEEVVYYLTEEFRSAVEATGAIFRPYQSFMGKPPQSPPQQAGGGPPAQRSQEGIAQMLERVRAEKPDYILYDPMHLWARVIAQILHVPAIRSCSMFVENEHYNPLKEHLNLLNGKVSVPLPVPPMVLERIQADINKVCIQHNLPLFDMRDFYTYPEPLNIVYVPRAFHPAGASFDERYVFVGPSLLPDHGAATFPTDALKDQPTLYISFGTIFNDRPDFFNLCFDAFGKQSWQVVLACGNRVDEGALGPVPENFQLAPYVPQHEVFPHTSVFVTHGGMASVMESLYYGVPMVVIPQQFEQTQTAQRITELGLGITLDQKDLTAEALREAVTRVYSDFAFHQRVQTMQQTVRAAGGYQRAADAIINFSHQHALTIH